jgi:transcriptional regulator with XRE-family HTH domain
VKSIESCRPHISAVFLNFAWYIVSNNRGGMGMLGARIAALRRKRGLSQTQLAQAVGVSPSAIGMYEQGRREPSAALLVALAQQFDVSTDYLLTGKPSQAEMQMLRQLMQERLNRTNPRDLPAGELEVLLAAVLTAP